MPLGVKPIYAAVVSDAEQLGFFESVTTHEPKSAPGNGLVAAAFLRDTVPVPARSGLSATTTRVLFDMRIYTSFMKKPEDEIDQDLLTAVDTLMAQYSAGFTLGGLVDAVDLLGIAGTALGANFGYLEQDRKMFRVAGITLPLLIENLWTQAP